MGTNRRTRRPHASIQAWMDAEGLTQEKAAKRLGISNTHLCNILRERYNCSLKVAKRIARIANVPLESIGSEQPKKYGEVA